MKRATTALIAICALMLTVAGAQTPPSFAGKWTLVPDANSQAAAGMVAQTVNITQDANTLTMTRTTQMGEITTTYKLDGSESKNTLNFQGNSMDQVSIAKWDASKLKIDTKMNVQGQDVQLSSVLSLDPSGNLILETTRPDFQGGGAPVTTKLTYKK
jgi:hypothetical protein